MNNFKKYIPEYILLFITIALTVSGFWPIFFGAESKPTPQQILHAIVNFSWLFLVLYQVSLIGNKQGKKHKRVGLSILFFGPLLFAHGVLLAIHSAHKGVLSGEGDFLIVQNVFGTIELGIILLMAFILKKRREIHGAFLIGTIVLMFGVAIFFLFLAIAPQLLDYGMYITLFVGFLFFLKNRRNGWPTLLVSSIFVINSNIDKLLQKNNLIQPLTEFVGSLNQVATAVVAFLVLFMALMLTGIMKRKRAIKMQPVIE